MVFIGAVVGKIAVTKESEELWFYSCEHCNLLNVMQYEGKESSYYTKEHFHEETDTYEGSVDIQEYTGYSWQTSQKADIGLTGPTRKVSDGLFRHEKSEEIYICSRCKENKRTRRFDRVVRHIDNGEIYDELRKKNDME